MNQRDYDPVVKRFLTADPTFFEDPGKCLKSPVECHLYGYAKNDPVSFVDPEGRDSYRVDRSIGGDTPNPYSESKFTFSHTFIAITDQLDGVERVTDTFSFGNDWKSWFHNADNDKRAAEGALDKGFAFKISDNPGMDQAFKEAFSMKAQEQHGWRPWDNCKHAADSLTNKAVDIFRYNNETIERIFQSGAAQGNSSKINDFF